MIPGQEDALALFHPLVAGWFEAALGTPTAVQAMAWPRIAAGRNVLVTAPTGSGKTLAAFLWALDRLITSDWPLGHTSVLYVSPLKALNNDVQRNLLGPLDELAGVFAANGRPFPELRVLTRSGDTPQSERRSMVRRPPEILITTPESLNLLLSSAGGRSILTGPRVVILDEIHAVFGNKRGVHLITAVDRLVGLGGEFQRLALSATIRPLEKVAEFVGGQTASGDPAHPEYTPRPVEIIWPDMAKSYEVRVRCPDGSTPPDENGSVWGPLTAEFKKTVLRNRSTLLFTNSRRLAEKIAMKINAGEDQPLAYAHHGSLSREIRTEVEGKLKNGGLRAIVATNSLELGLDVGSLDEVILIQSPPSVSSALQRLGRAGHRVGQVSRGAVFPTHALDFVEAAVLAAAVPAQEIEEVRPVEAPLDVLAQVLVSMTAAGTWDLDELYAFLRTSHPYRELGRRQFDLVLDMLAGRYADSRLRELRPKVIVDRRANTASARPGALLSLYTGGGMIPDRGYYNLRLHETGALIGELDEEFVWEARIGQTFTLGAQTWRIKQITHNDVFVLPGRPGEAAAPFWHGEEAGRDFHFSEKVGLFLEEAEERVERADYPDFLRREYHLDKGSARRLVEFLRLQRERTGRPLPHRHHLLVEHVSSGPAGVPGHQVVLHTLWGLRVNRPLALALDATWEERFGQRPRVHASDDAVVMLLPGEVESEELLGLVPAARVEELLRQRLEGSGFFGARFRECAGRALLLGRRKVGERMPLWMSRLRSRKLLEAVAGYGDFPILLEAWRTCLRDEFDLGSLKSILAEIESGAVAWSEVRMSLPSPLARTTAWRQVNEYMYMGDDPVSSGESRLRGDLLREVVFSPGLRPALRTETVAAFESKLRRLAPGYAPGTPGEVLFWARERVALPEAEWRELLAAIQRDHGLSEKELAGALAGRLVRFEGPRLGEPLAAAFEEAPRLARALGAGEAGLTVRRLFSGEPVELPAEDEEDPDEALNSVLGEWLRFYGPVSPEFIALALGLEPGRLALALEDLAEAQKTVSGRLTLEGPDHKVCDAENFETLLRLSRAEAVPAFEPLPPGHLAFYLADWQGLTRPAQGLDGLERRLGQLLCLPLPAGLWEAEVLPARLDAYDPSWLDTVIQSGELRWVGREKRTAAFCFESDLDLLAGEEGEGDQETEAASTLAPSLFPAPGGRYDFTALLRHTGLGAKELWERLWEEVWRGRASNDTFLALRRALETRFRAPGLAGLRPEDARPRRMRVRAWFAAHKGPPPPPGAWLALPRPEPPEDLIAREETVKDRVRLLLDRYGVLSREVLQREAFVFRWPAVFRALRLMELSGEVHSGCFFQGLSGPQFISPRFLRRLQRGPDPDAVFWLNAADPASPCGLALEGLESALPRRMETTHLVFRGTEPMLVSERQARVLTINAPPDDPDLLRFFAPLHHLLQRRYNPLRRLRIETINGRPAAQSPYQEALRTAFELLTDLKALVLYRSPDNGLPGRGLK
ncbi:MAG: DEAD/DEAH box helicase [Thermodesulfobacteriota bacterium]